MLKKFCDRCGIEITDKTFEGLETNKLSPFKVKDDKGFTVTAVVGKDDGSSETDMCKSCIIEVVNSAK